MSNVIPFNIVLADIGSEDLNPVNLIKRLKSRGYEFDDTETLICNRKVIRMSDEDFLILFKALKEV